MNDHTLAGLSGLRLGLILALLWAFPPSSWFQGNLGRLIGHVTEPSGAGKLEASVRVTNLDTSEERSVISSNDGG